MCSPELNSPLLSCCFPQCNLEKFTLKTAIMSNKPSKEKNSLSEAA